MDKEKERRGNTITKEDEGERKKPLKSNNILNRKIFYPHLDLPFK